MPSSAMAVGRTEAHGFECQMSAAVLGVRGHGATALAKSTDLLNVKAGRIPAPQFSSTARYSEREVAAATIWVLELTVSSHSSWMERTCGESRLMLIETALSLTANGTLTTIMLTMDCSSVTKSSPMAKITATPPATLSFALMVGPLSWCCVILVAIGGVMVARFGAAVGARFPRSVAVALAVFRVVIGLLESREFGAASGLEAARSVAPPGGLARLGGAVCSAGGAVAVGPDVTVLDTAATGTVVAVENVWAITIAVVVAITIRTVTNDRRTQETATPTVLVTTASRMQTTVLLLVIILLVVLPFRLLPVSALVVMTPFVRAVGRK